MLGDGVAGLAVGHRVVAVHSAAGGVGLLALQLARARGATRVIGIVGTAAKAEVARTAGADEVLVRDDDYPAHLHELTDGTGVDLVLNSVGGATVARDLSAAAEFGAVVVFGQSSGGPGRVPTDALHQGKRGTSTGKVVLTVSG